jgi:hypothetical protein
VAFCVYGDLIPTQGLESGLQGSPRPPTSTTLIFTFTGFCWTQLLLAYPNSTLVPSEAAHWGMFVEIQPEVDFGSWVIGQGHKGSRKDK